MTVDFRARLDRLRKLTEAKSANVGFREALGRSALLDRPGFVRVKAANPCRSDRFGLTLKALNAGPGVKQGDTDAAQVLGPFISQF